MGVIAYRTFFGFKRGHKIIWNPEKKNWFYADTGECATIVRSCARCGEMPTKEGHDACLGTLPNVKFACCGHGVKEGYQVDSKGAEKPMCSRRNAPGLICDGEGRRECSSCDCLKPTGD